MSGYKSVREYFPWLLSLCTEMDIKVIECTTLSFLKT